LNADWCGSPPELLWAAATTANQAGDTAALATFSQLQLSILAVARGRLDEARALLDERPAVSLAAYSTQNVTLALGGRPVRPGVRRWNPAQPPQRTSRCPR
jgi:hypothetical protein